MATSPPNPELAALPDLFLFDSRNRKFLEDGSQPLAGDEWLLHPTMIWWSLIVFLLPALLGLDFAAQWLISMLYVGLSLILLVLWARAIRHHRRLKFEGQLLLGWVIQSKKRSWLSSHLVWLRYAVITPDGKEHQLTDYVIDPEGRRFLPYGQRRQVRALPEPGTPIAVLYVNEKLHKVL